MTTRLTRRACCPCPYATGTMPGDDHSLYRALKDWRARQANRQGVELYRIFLNTAIDDMWQSGLRTPSSF